MKALPQQGASSAERPESVRPAEEPGPSQKQERSAGSRRFTPAQQAVAAALMVVMKRAMKGGKEAAWEAKKTLHDNNIATSPFLMMVVEGGPLLTLKQIEQSASDEVLESLTRLASHCAAAQCQPLEVFTRSMQCRARTPLANIIALERDVYERQQEDDQQHAPPAPPSYQDLTRALQQLGLQRGIVDLVISCMRAIGLYRQYGSDALTLVSSDITHLLPGVVDAIEPTKARSYLRKDVLIGIVSAFTSAVQAYQVRATACGKSYQHMVLLEAAVAGWSLDTPFVGPVVSALLAAQPSSSAASAKVASGQEQAPQSHALSCLEESSADILPIFKQLISVMDLSDKDLSLIPPRALSREDKHLKALLSGLLPGIVGELYCAFSDRNAEMRPDLFAAAARHVQSFVQVWRSEAKAEGSNFLSLLQRKVKALGFKPGELPKEVQSAINDISTRVGTDLADGVPWHPCVTGILKRMHEWHKTGDNSSSDYWMMKAVAQQFDLRIYHAKDAKVVKADLALLLGQFGFLADPQRVPRGILETYLETTLHTMKQILHAHLKLAQMGEMSLRDYLEDIAGYRTAGWGAGKAEVGHLIDILVNHVAEQVGRPGEAWRKLAPEDPEMARVMESASAVAIGMGYPEYCALCRVFPGLTRYVRAQNYDSGQELLIESRFVKQQIQVHKHIASVQKAPFRLYLAKLLTQYGIDTKQQAARNFLEATCRTADGLTVNAATARVVHIHMRIKNIVHEGDAAVTSGNSFLMLLNRFMFLRILFSQSPQPLQAIRKAMPGLVDCLTGLHKWPHGLDAKEEKWLPQATQVTRDIMEKHARDARNRGISPHEHVRKILDAPGLPDGQVDAIMVMYDEFWAAQNKAESAAASRPRAHIPKAATAANPSAAPADSSRAKGQSRRAKAKEAAADSGSGSAEAETLSQHGADRAADVAGGATGKKLAKPGQSKPVQDVQEAAQSQSGQSGPSKEAGKAEKRKAEETQEQAAQMAEAIAVKMSRAEGTGNKELEPSEGMGSASQQEPPAEAHGDEQPPEAAHFIRGSRFAALGSLPADSIPASSSREAASSSTSSSLSAQLLLPLHSGTTPRGQREESLPRSVAQAAQAPASDSEDEGPWQEVKASRRKAASQQAFSQAGARKAPSQDRSGPDQEHSATSPSRLGDLQAAAQHAEQGLPKPEKAAVPPQEQPVPDGAEHLPQWLPGLACDQPQQPSQHKNPDSVQHPDCSAGTSLHEQMAKVNLSEQHEDDEELCVVCWEKAPEVIFCHCMHRCTCQGCAKDIMAAGALCPMCRANIQDTITTKF